MLNNDTEVLTPNWLELMLGDARRSEVGTVGVRLYYPGAKLIQHAGIGIGLGSYAANITSGVDSESLNISQNLYVNCKRNVACNTAACIMVSKKLFNEVGGFDSAFSITYNDVDLGLKLLNKGYVNIYNPAVEVIHHESVSLGTPDDDKRDGVEIDHAKNALVKKWDKYVQHDPYYNPNFNKDFADFSY